MKIHKLETGNFKLDGGAIFGVIPKSLWNKVYPADENNMCNFSMRCLLIETGGKRILIDTGLGTKQSEKFFGYYYLNGEDNLQQSLHQIAITRDDITDVILTHLHFDHCGGAVEKLQSGELRPTFSNATYWISRSQWEWAQNPNIREQASFLEENILPLQASGQLRFIEKEGPFNHSIELRIYNGHTEGLLVPFIHYHDRTLVYTTDMLPTAAHIPASWICGYDTRPLISMQERTSFMQEAIEKDYILFFEHDLYHECVTLQPTEKGPVLDRSFSIEEFMGSLS